MIAAVLRSALPHARPLVRTAALALAVPAASSPALRSGLLHTSAALRATDPDAQRGASVNQDVPSFNDVPENPHPLPRPSDPAYFTGNPNYYNMLRELNFLIRKHGIPFRSKPTLTRNWRSMADMTESMQMRLTTGSYMDLVHRLNLLFPLQDQDVTVRRILEKFVPLGQKLERRAPSKPQLDEHGRSYTTGSRKTSRSQCWLVPGDGQIYVNGSRLNEYFPMLMNREAVVQPFEVADRLAKYNVWAIVSGGGPNGQADAIGVAIARGLAVHEPELEPILVKGGLTKVDIRQVERKKTGQPKARKKNAWVKR